ncbi:MAG: hypothetical protein ACRDF0_03855, partial [Candidatus Limnocylindria bacterium]
AGAAQIVALRPAVSTPACTLTVDVLRNAAVLGSGSAVIAGAATTLVTSSFATSAATFAAGDRLHVRVSQPASASCAVTASFDGAGAVSRLVHP